MHIVGFLCLGKGLAKVRHHPELFILTTLHEGTSYGCIRGVAVYLKRAIPHRVTQQRSGGEPRLEIFERLELFLGVLGPKAAFLQQWAQRGGDLCKTWNEVAEPVTGTKKRAQLLQSVREAHVLDGGNLAGVCRDPVAGYLEATPKN